MPIELLFHRNFEELAYSVRRLEMEHFRKIIVRGNKYSPTGLLVLGLLQQNLVFHRLPDQYMKCKMRLL